MPTKRKRLARGRRTITGSPAELWKQGRYIEAWALDPLIEFTESGHLMTVAELDQADALRRQWGLGPWPDGADDA